jgi:hypothetical protein
MSMQRVSEPPGPRRSPAIAVVALVATAAPSHADTVPCVFRDSTIVRPVHAVGLGAHALSFCTGADCWALDLAAHAFGSSPAIDSPRAEAEAERRAVRAASRADMRSATFCVARGRPCRTVRYAFRLGSTAEPRLAINEAGTLGTVTLHLQGHRAIVPVTMIFDLATGRELGRFLAGDAPVHVIGRQIFADDRVFDARGNLLHTYRDGTSDLPPVLITHARVASIRLSTGRLALFDLATGTERTVELGLTSSRGRFAALQPSADGRQLYAIAGWPFEGEVLAIDTETATVTSRHAPLVCRDR